MLDHMKQILVQLDEPLARKLERFVPGSSRKRSKFIRDAIERALLAASEAETQAAYLRQPAPVDENGWLIEPYPVPATVKRRLDRIMAARDRAGSKSPDPRGPRGRRRGARR